MKRRYWAFVEGASEGGFSAWFPAIDGCVTAGATLDEVNRNAHEALLLHLEGMLEDGEELPPPQNYGDADVHRDLAACLEIIVDLGSKRYNVILPRDIVSRIDAISSNRSGFLADAAREKLDSD